jgi:DnaJ-class molecular chaperone
MTLEELEWAKKILDISIPMSLSQIERNYKKLAKNVHPDVSGAETASKTADLNRAIAIVREYCMDYQFDFSEEQFYFQFPEERIQKMFWKDVKPAKKPRDL